MELLGEKNKASAFFFFYDLQFSQIFLLMVDFDIQYKVA